MLQKPIIGWGTGSLNGNTPGQPTGATCQRLACRGTGSVGPKNFP